LGIGAGFTGKKFEIIEHCFVFFISLILLDANAMIKQFSILFISYNAGFSFLYLVELQV
jgi:hypothetical protein